jgi:hypothetical protein
MANAARTGVDGSAGCTSLSLSRIPMSSFDCVLLASNIWGEGESFGVPPSDNDLVLVGGDLTSPTRATDLFLSSIGVKSKSPSMSDILEMSSMSQLVSANCRSRPTKGFGDDRFVGVCQTPTR